MRWFQRGQLVLLLTVYARTTSAFSLGRLPTGSHRRHCLVSDRPFSTFIMSASANDGNPPTPPSDEERKYTRVHHVTVCMVPPPEENEKLWDTLSAMRRQMKDPGYYRWPPHVNLLYPFLNLKRPKSDEEASSTLLLPEIVEKLESATQQIPPFSVRLQEFGTFGGKQRGVLWLHPDSQAKNESDSGEESGPLIRLQHLLQEAFPMCHDQAKQGRFVPHMTVSHFPNNHEALQAQAELEASFPERGDMEFLLDRVYLLKRKGDDGQFLRVAEIALGPPDARKVETRIFDPPEAFSKMPATEEDWVYTARMEMKTRRNKNQRRRRKKSPAKEHDAAITNDAQQS